MQKKRKNDLLSFENVYQYVQRNLDLTLKPAGFLVS